jgi:hypothetical protein
MVIGVVSLNLAWWTWGELMKIRFGDIAEIKTSIGLAYAIYTHRHTQPPKYGALIRVFDQLYQSRPVRICGNTGTPY